MLISCQKMDTSKSDWINFGEGVPVIEKIVDPGNYDQVITRAPLGAPIKIIGKNLYSVDKVIVNGIDVSTQISHVKDVMYVVLPVTPPENDTDKSITIENKWGKATSELALYADMRVDGMKCEYVKQGSNLVILGEYFALNGFGTGGRVLIGDVEAPIQSSDNSQITVTVPQSAQANSVVTLVSDAVGEVTVPGKFQDSDYVLLDFESLSSGTYLVVDGTDPAPLTGSKYLCWNGSYSSWSWTEVSGYSNATKKPTSDHLSDQSKYWLKFEVCTKKTSTLQYMFRFRACSGTPTVYWPAEDPAKKYEFSTGGEWITVKIPFEDVEGFVAGDEGKGLFQVLISTAESQSDCNISFDNFRLSLK